MGPGRFTRGVVLAAVLAVWLPGAAVAATRNLQFAFEFGGPGSGGPGQLATYADGVATDIDGNVWVADSFASRVVKYDYNGTFIAAFTGPGAGTWAPSGIAADASGIYVVDRPRNRVVQVTTGGVLVRQIGNSGAPAKQLNSPSYDALDSKGDLYVSDARGVEEYAADGTFVRAIPITNPGGAQYLAIGLNDDIYVSTGPGRKILRLSKAGTVLNSWDSSIGATNGLAFDPSLPLLYSANGNGIIQEFNPDLTFVQNLGQPGIGQGQMNIPNGAAVDCRGSLYAVDGGVPMGSKVLKFADPASEPPPCAPPAIPGNLDTQINDVEITQGTQPIRTYTATDSPGGRTRPYGVGRDPSGQFPSEVPLRGSDQPSVASQGQIPKTVVRVYANLRSGPAGGVASVPATLETSCQGTLAGSPKVIQADSGPSILKVGNTTVGTAERSNPAGAYTFTLPDHWLECGSLTLTARVNPAGLGCDQACHDRSTFRLTGIGLTHTPLANIHPIALTVNGAYPTINGASLKSSPDPAFASALTVTPYDLDVWNWATQIEVGDVFNGTSVKVEKCFLGIKLGITCSDKTYTQADGQDFRDALENILWERIENYINDNYDYARATRTGWVANPHLYFGLLSSAGVSGQLAGATRGILFSKGFQRRPTSFVPRIYAVTTRPLTSIAHELNHALGREHASNCNGGGSNGQVAESWPPDEQGYLDGIGLDPRAGSGGFTGPYKVYAAGAPGNPSAVFDFMSYCAAEAGGAWISPKGWNEVINYRNDYPAHDATRGIGGEPAHAAAGQPVLSVHAIQTGDGTLIMTRALPAVGFESQGNPASPYRLEARDSAGNILASIPVDAQPGHSHADPYELSITGTIRRPPGTAQLVLRRGTETATRVQRSAHPPTVSLISPRGGKLVGERVPVRWRAGDKDHDPLLAELQYSPDGGRHWNGVWVGPSRGRVAISARLLKASRAGRLRVVVNDGFDDATATSGQLDVVGAPPEVRIQAPVGRQRLRADAPLYLQGQSAGDEGAPLLRTRALAWFDGGRQLGHGRALSVTGLLPGRHTIRLVANEGGRVGTASVRIVVRAVKPEFLVLRSPARITRGARFVRLQVASTVAATLVVAGQRFTVSAQPKSLRVRVQRGASPLKLTLTLRAGRFRTLQTVTIPRA